MTANSYKIVTAGLVGMTLLTGAVLASTKVSADNDSTIDQIEITVPTSCTMSGSITTGNEHTATINPGIYSGDTTDFANGIGKTTLTTYCNDYNGFSIYAIGFTGDVEGDNTLKGTSSSGNATIATKAYESGDTTSNWSMKLTKITDSSTSYNPSNMTITTGYDGFHAVPDDYTKVVEYKASTGSSATDQGTGALGAKLETTYAAFVSTTQPADTYTGQVKYVMVHPYNGTAPEILEEPLSQCTAPLSNKVAGITNMQDINSGNISTVLGAINTGEQYFLRDSRDNQPYCVSKLADGKLWMTENLNLAGGTALSATDTDVTSTYISSFSTSNNLTKTNDTIVLPTSDTAGFNTNNYSYVYNSGNKTNCGASGQNTPCFSYYSWDAATLGSGRSIASENTDAEQSICPKGWRLPTSGNSSNNEWKRGDFYALATAYGANLESNYYESSATFYNNAGPGTTPNFLLAGIRFLGLFGGGGSYGLYWSSTSYSSTINARFLDFNSSSVYSSKNSDRYYGGSVRCLYGS